MKLFIFNFIATGLFATTLYGQTPTAGKITYEGMRQMDFSQMRGNGPGGGPPGGGGGGASESSDGPPEVMTFTQKLVFAGTMAKEERDRPQGNMMRRNRASGDASGQNGPGGGGDGNRPWRGGANGQRMAPPFEQTTFLDLGNRQRIEILTVKKDSASQMYRSAKPIPTATDWATSDKTRKIAGYTCHKATATRRKESYTIWYTTDLPFTYSPVADLTPPTGVVLQIESDTESYKATGVSMEAVAEDSVQPPKDAKVISAEEMDQLRRKGMADFRQKMMQNMPMTNRN